MNVQQQIRWTLLGIGVVPLSVFIAVYSSIFYESSETAAKNHINDLAATSANQLSNVLVNAARDTRALAASNWDDAVSSQASSSKLSQFTYSYPYFKAALWVKPDGAVLGSSNRRHSGQTLGSLYPHMGAALAQTLRQSAGKFTLLEAKADAATDHLLTFMLRVDNARGEAAGVLVTSLLADPIQAVLRDAQLRVPGEAAVGLLNIRGEVLISSDGSDIHDKHQWLSSTTGTVKSDLSQEHTSVIEDSHGKDIVAIAPLPGIAGQEPGAWRVVVVAPLDIVTARAHQSLVQTVVPMITMVVFILLVSLFIGRRVVKKVKRMIAGTQAISDGDLAARIELDGAQDELRMLAQAFNAMAQKIEVLALAKDKDAEQLASLASSLQLHAVQLESSLKLTKQQNREITLRNEIGDLLQSCLRVDEVGSIVDHYLPQLFPDSTGALYLSREEQPTMEAVALWGSNANHPIRQEFDSAECWGLRRGKPHCVVEGETTTLCDHVAPSLPLETLCIPMIARSETLGLLHLEFEHLSNPADIAHNRAQVELATSVGALLAMAVANLRLNAALLEESIHDKLTGLYNRRHLETVLPREIARASREERSLAILMMDVDHFKLFNDAHGHEAGDAVLRGLGLTLRESCRLGDTACRFGGEEFTILLPDTDELAAREWGNRLRRDLCGMKVSVGALQLPAVTVSLGLALYPGHGDDKDSLLKAADVALYDAKRAGRDRLMCSGDYAVSV